MEKGYIDTGDGKGLGKGGGRGKNGGGGFSIGGYCVCSKCGKKVEHRRGVPCTDMKCSDCGISMIREELLNAKRETK